MNADYRRGLTSAISSVFAQHPSTADYRRRFSWLTGALGDPNSGIWFVAEHPSLGQVERVADPHGGGPTEEAQWWASRGDRLFRNLLVKHGFKTSRPEIHGGWRCYITNAIEEADYAERWRGSPTERQRKPAEAWAPVSSMLERRGPALVSR
jgi:hypothetical protein